jgi:hypothetical protein
LNGTLLSGLATGILKNTTATGVPSIAVANTDYLPVNNAAMTGVPTAPTAAVATNTTQLATTAFVIANAGGGGSAPVVPYPFDLTTNTPLQWQKLGVPSNAAYLVFGVSGPFLNGVNLNATSANGEAVSTSSTGVPSTVGYILAGDNSGGQYQCLRKATVKGGYGATPLTNVAIGFGLSSSGSGPGTNNSVEFSYDSSKDGTVFYRAVTTDSGGTQTRTVTTIPFVNSDSHTWSIDMTNFTSSIPFYCDGVLVATNTTHLPSNQTGFFIGVQCQTLDAVIKTANLGPFVMRGI